jgi:ankyrin repeat protein
MGGWQNACCDTVEENIKKNCYKCFKNMWYHENKDDYSDYYLEYFDDDGNSYLHLACMVNRCKYDIIEFLLYKKYDLNKANNEGVTPLMYLLDQPQYDRTMQCFTNVNIEAVDIHGRTMLHYVSLETDDYLNKKDVDTKLSFVKHLIDKIHVNSVDKNYNTPLHIAAINYDEEYFDLLVSKGADINVKNTEGLTPMDIMKTNDTN